ncbi:hypothetical protein CL645_01450 [bacterium]|nr:hypothetical protein [bacterium]|tara:strand:- start:149 stop:1225 length:1077 start_codon:yes stop_codon:yes gene_type:complete
MKKEIYILFLMFTTAFQSSKIESKYEIAGPWGQGLDVENLNWLDNENFIFLEENSFPPFEKMIKHVDINKNGISFSKKSIGEILSTNDNKILWIDEKMPGSSLVWYGEIGQEKIIAESQNKITAKEIAWTEDKKLWIRGWVDNETYLLKNKIQPVKSSKKSIYYLESNAIKKTTGKITETIYSAKEGVKIVDFANDKHSNLIVLETKINESQLKIIKHGKAAVTLLPWTKIYTIGVYGGMNIGWRMNPKENSQASQKFCSIKPSAEIETACFEAEEGHFMQVYQWALDEQNWINSSINVQTNQIHLTKWNIENQNFETIAKMDKLKNIKISPDRKKIAIIATSHEQHWNWDIFILDLN